MCTHSAVKNKHQVIFPKNIRIQATLKWTQKVVYTLCVCVHVTIIIEENNARERMHEEGLEVEEGALGKEQNVVSED